MNLIRLPRVFFDDHWERELPTPTVVKHTKTNYWIASDDPNLAELLSDAEFYCHPYGPDDPELGWLKTSARATVKAIRKSMSEQAA
jgi:hypothetical protein